MVNIKEVEYYGLKVKLEPSDERTFYLTGEETVFKLTITNTEDRKRSGKIGLRLRYGHGLGSPYARFIHPEPCPAVSEEL